MIKARRIGHATFETPDLSRMIDYHTRVTGMTAVAQAQDRVFFAARTGQLAIELKKAPQARCVGPRSGAGAPLRRHDPDIGGGYRDMIEPRPCGHLRIAPRVAGRQAALVAEVDVPSAPVGARRAQAAVYRARRPPARERHVKLPAVADRARRRVEDAARRGLLQHTRAGQLVPSNALRGRPHCVLQRL